MVITHHNGSCFKIQFGDTIIALNPPSKRSSIKGSRFGADIVLISADHEDMNGKEEIGIGDRQPFVIDGPGEYEVKDIFIRGFASETGYGGEKIRNTIYTIAIEGMNICFTGAQGTVDLPQDMRQAIEHIDILFVPVGDKGVLSASEAAKFTVSIEPAVVVPMPFGDGGNEAMRVFEKEMGAEKSEPLDKLTVKKRDLEGKEGEVVVIGSSVS